MSTAAISTTAEKQGRHLAFVAIVLISSLGCYRVLSALVHYSIQDDSSSHTILIPFVSAVLLYLERRRIFSAAKASLGCGVGIMLAGAALYWVVGRSESAVAGSGQFSLAVFAVILMWWGGFVCCYGSMATREALFPLLFLFLTVPFPQALLDRVIYALQSGSTEIAYLVFQATGTPVLKHGFMLAVPGVTIEVAKECSSIRSSIALFITCLLAAHLYLRTSWKMALLVLVSLPLSILKNGVRIATLTLLSVYVTPDFLTGKLHRDGGFAFFAFALLLLWPVLWLLWRSEPKRDQ